MFQKWRSVEIDGTLGLVSTVSQSKEWPMHVIDHCTGKGLAISTFEVLPLSATELDTLGIDLQYMIVYIE